MIKEVMSANTVKLRLPVSVKIHLVVNVSRVVRYKELVKEQRVEESKLVGTNDNKEYKVEKILNKRIVQEYIKYLVR